MKDNAIVGHITSGTFSPTLGRPIAMGYLDAALKDVGTRVDIMIRAKAHPARVVRPSFYKRK
jgi:aminomethyltransferase